MAAAAKRKNDIWNTSTVEGLSLAFTSPGVKYSAEGASISRERKKKKQKKRPSCYTIHCKNKTTTDSSFLPKITAITTCEIIKQ
jgi:hypothetical protein